MNHMAISIPGGWNIADMQPVNLPQKAASAFSGATEPLVGASYEPVLYCGQQVVNGVNYGVVCKQTIPAPGGAYEHLVFMSLHEAPDGGRSEDSEGSDSRYSIAAITPII